MAEVELRVKQWGNSLALILPKELIQKEHIKKDEKVKVAIRKLPKIKDIWGLAPDWKIDPQKAKDELRKMW